MAAWAYRRQARSRCLHTWPRTVQHESSLASYSSASRRGCLTIGLSLLWFIGKSTGNVHVPSGAEAMFTWKWRKPLVDAEASSLLSAAQEPWDAARIRAVTSSETASFFSNLPNSRQGTRLSNEAFTVAVALRLGVFVAFPGTCVCGSPLDPHGNHALACRREEGRHGRHVEVNSRLKSSLTEAGVASILELRGLTRDDGKRPDGMTVPSFSRVADGLGCDNCPYVRAQLSARHREFFWCR